MMEQMLPFFKHICLCIVDLCLSKETCEECMVVH